MKGGQRGAHSQSWSGAVLLEGKAGCVATMVNDRRFLPGREPDWPPKEWGQEFPKTFNGAEMPGSSALASRAGLGGEYRPLAGVSRPLAPFPSLGLGDALLTSGTPGFATPEEGPEDTGEQYLIFLLAGYESGIKAEHVQAVERLPDVTPVPNLAPWISGVINLRGQIISVVDVRTFLGLEPAPVSPRTRMIAGRVGEMVIGLVVDGVSEMRGILPNMIQLQGTTRALPAWAVPYVGGVATIGNQSVMLIEMERLLLSEKMQQYQG